MTRGPLIAVEGIDGSGTTTLVRGLAIELGTRGLNTHATREPSDGPVGRLLREMLAGRHQPVDEITLGLLFAADRADHVQREVEPARIGGAIVISDRWYHSSLAYQGAAKTRAWIRELNKHAPTPDLTIFVDIPPAIAAERRASRGEADEIFDELSTQERVAKGYAEVVTELTRAGERIEVIDGRQPAEVVLRQALEVTLAAFPLLAPSEG